MPLMRQGQGQGDLKNNINYVSPDRTFITLRLPVWWYNNGIFFDGTAFNWRGLPRVYIFTNWITSN